MFGSYLLVEGPTVLNHQALSHMCILFKGYVIQRKKSCIFHLAVGVFLVSLLLDKSEEIQIYLNCVFSDLYSCKISFPL